MEIVRPAPTPFIGRDDELKTIAELLTQPAVRLVTLLGPAGVGKTRLALQVVELIGEAFPDGILTAELVSVRDANAVVPAILRSAGGADTGSLDPMLQLVESLRGARTLLLLDNFEHVIGAAPAVASLLRECHGLRILVTSRRPLRLRAEHTVSVAPMTTPDPSRATASELMEFDAVALLADRMRAADHRFQPSNDVAPALTRICRRLDGLPLAIELVAPLIRVLPAGAIATLLEHRLDHLVHGPLDVPDRHRTMRDALTWSAELLSEPARRAFAQLSVFLGGWSLPAARAVLVEPEETVVLVIDELVTQCLVSAATTGDEARFHFLEVIREFAAEQLASAEDQEEVCARHARFFVEAAEQVGSGLGGRGMAEVLGWLERERGNFEAALDWAIASGATDVALRLSSALRMLWYVRGSVHQGLKLCKAALALPGGSRQLRARALSEASTLARQQGDFDVATLLVDEAVELARTIDDALALRGALFQRGFLNHLREDYLKARADLEESAQLASAAGDRLSLARALHHLGFVAVHSDGDVAAAWTLQEQSLLLAREADSRRLLATVLLAMAEISLIRQQRDAGWELVSEALGIIRALEDWPLLTFGLFVAASLAADDRRYVLALRLLGAIDSLERATGSSLWPVQQRTMLARLRAAEQSLGSRRAAQLRAEGSRLTPSDAIVYTQHRDDDRQSPLTRREDEVAAYVAEGLTNREIATRLFLSERTIDGHVARVLAKLGLRTRSQIAAWVVTNGVGPSQSAVGQK